MLVKAQDPAAPEELLSHHPVVNGQVVVFTTGTGRTQVRVFRDYAWRDLSDDDFIGQTAAWAYERMYTEVHGFGNSMFFIEQLGNFAANLAVKALLRNPEQYAAGQDEDMLRAVIHGLHATLHIIQSPIHLVVPELQRQHLLPQNPQLAYIQQLMIELHGFDVPRSLLTNAFISGVDMIFCSRLARLLASNPAMARRVSWLDQQTLANLKTQNGKCRFHPIGQTSKFLPMRQRA